MEIQPIFFLVSLLSLYVTGIDEELKFIEKDYKIYENVPKGQQLFVLEAVGDTNLRYGIKGTNDAIHVFVNGKVIARRSMDYERQKEVDVTFTVIGSRGKETTWRTVIKVFDQNDSPPTFSEDTYDKRIPEDTPVGTTIIKDLLITDVDDNNGILTVQCTENPNDKTQGTNESCNVFAVKNVGLSNKNWKGNVVLKKPLNYEDRAIWQIPIRVLDGVNTYLASIEVLIMDVQDLPPYWVSANNIVEVDGTRANKELITVLAVDGDKGLLREIYYEIIGNPGNLFRIDSKKGKIYNNRVLDREDPLFAGGFVNIELWAREVISRSPSLDLGNNATNSAKKTITCTILDLNDNKPVFNQRSYTVTVREDIQRFSPIPNLIITVNDPDFDRFGHYNISISNFQDRFEVSPTTGLKETYVSIRLKTPLDYEKGDRQFIFDVIAMEDRTTPSQSSTATVTINVLDINDNSPIFEQSEYIAIVSETARQGTPVIRVAATDEDSLNLGSTGLRYTLSGNGHELFTIDDRTGQISVAFCATPGSGNCLDYEQKRQYYLYVTATDNLGNAPTRSTVKGVWVNIKDENDNAPIFELPKYVGYINEDTVLPNPSLIVRAIDKDSANIQYSITGGDGQRLFQINNAGVITAKAPIDYDKNQPMYTLTVTANDLAFQTDTTVEIYINDINDNRPIFTLSNYRKTISENAQPGTFIVTVTATDGDRPTTRNGQFTYRLEYGSKGKFVMDSQGTIRVAPNATFDYDTQKQYIMEISATDKGATPLSSSAKVYVDIIDENDNPPRFIPPIVRVAVYENVTIGTFVANMTAFDKDVNHKLQYSFIDPAYGINSARMKVQKPAYDVTALFTIDADSGVVRTKSKNFDYDKAVELYQSVLVRDVNANPVQSATGTLIVNVINLNFLPPEFLPPWIKGINEVYHLKIREEMPVPSFITTVVAYDPDGVIIGYKLIEDNGKYVELGSVSGVVKSVRRIDYETEPFFRFVVTTSDDGLPTMTATATYSVTVINVNDETPAFNQTSYSVSIYEHSPEGTSVVTVNASDKDTGEFGKLRYSLNNIEKNFQIDPNTGLITVKKGAVLDREKTPTLYILAYVNDNPNGNSSNGDIINWNSVPVYITLLDINDHKPVFTNAIYETTIIETIPVDRFVLAVRATDLDMGINAKLKYTKIPGSGDPEDLFKLESSSGQILVNKILKGKAGVYKFEVKVQDMNGGPQTPMFEARAQVIITVQTSANDPPIWIFPATDNVTIEVLEEQYLGMTITQLKAKDTDPHRQYVEYGIQGANNVFSDRDADNLFRVNPITGVLQALQVYDYERVKMYTIIVLARDFGTPRRTAQRFLNIKILDVDDNAPVFPTFQNGTVKPVSFTALESAAVGAFIGQVEATDRDSVPKIFYHKIHGDPNEDFRVEMGSGKIFLRKKVDHEKQSKYTLEIVATSSNDITQGFSGPQSRQSSVVVTIHVIDVEDSTPAFEYKVYNACVSTQADVGASVLLVKANDKDIGAAGIVYYSIETIEKISGNLAVNNPFKIGELSGEITTNQDFKLANDNSFNLVLRGKNALAKLYGEADARIWVTEPTEEVKLVVARPPVEVYERLSIYKYLLSKGFGDAVVCVNQISYHASDDRQVIPTKTDIFFHLIRPETNKAVPAETAADQINKERTTDSRGLYNQYYVESAEVKTVSDMSLLGKVNPIIIAVVIFFAIILLAIIFLVVACCCIQRSFRKSSEMASHADDHRRVFIPHPDSSEIIVSNTKAEPLQYQRYSFVNKAYDAQPPVKMAPEYVIEAGLEPSNRI